MKNKIQNFELKIYELLGIKKFKKIVFFVAYKIFRKIDTTEEINYSYDNSINNYTIKKGNGLQGLRDFKKMLWLNASVHSIAVLLFIPCFLLIISSVSSIVIAILSSIPIILNIYCIVLQRYNYIRIDKILKKWEPMEQKQKEKICEEIKQEDCLSNFLTHKIIDEKNKVSDISIEEFMQGASLSQLRRYKKELEYMKKYLQNPCVDAASVFIGYQKRLQILKKQNNMNR